MNRRIVIQLTAPSVLIGLLLFGSCVAGVWSINRVQTNLARILSKNVASLQAAQELEIRLRQLRFHSFFYVLDPRPERQELVRTDEQEFEVALARAKAATNTPEEKALVAAIDDGFRRYRAELERCRKRASTREPSSSSGPTATRSATLPRPARSSCASTRKRWNTPPSRAKA